MFSLYGSRTLGNLKPAFRFTSHGSGKLVRVASPVTGQRFDIVDTTIMGDLSAALGVGKFLNVGMILPIFFSESQLDVNTLTSSRRGGVGDILLEAKIKLLEDRKDSVGVGLLSRLSLPAGDPQQFSGWKGPTGEWRLLIDKTFAPLYAVANVGYRIVSRTPVTNTVSGVEWNVSDDDRLIFGAGLQYTLPFQAKSWDLMASISGEQIIGNSSEITIPVEIDGGVQKRFGHGISVQIGLGRGITSALGSPSFRAFGSVGFDVGRLDAERLEKKKQKEKKKTINGTALFSFDDVRLSKAAKEMLQAVDEAMKENETVVVSIEGHADSTGSSLYNDQLGLRRAKAAARYLESMGIEGRRLKVISYGSSQPTHSNRTREGREQNRRVEIREVGSFP